MGIPLVPLHSQSMASAKKKMYLSYVHWKITPHQAEMGWNAKVFLFRGPYMLSFALRFCSTIVTCWQFSIFCLFAHHLPHFPPPQKKKGSSHHPCFRQIFHGIFSNKSTKEKRCHVHTLHHNDFLHVPSSTGSSWFHISNWVYQDPNLCWPKFPRIDDRKNIAHSEHATLWI